MIDHKGYIFGSSRNDSSHPVLLTADAQNNIVVGRFEAVREATTNSAVFSDVMLCSKIQFTDVLEKRTASTFEAEE
jgi:hypothetical protein